MTEQETLLYGAPTMTNAEEIIITIPVPPGMENLLDPKVIARRVANGERLNREMAAKYPDHPNWKIYD
jgi:hypothetical protein